MRGRLSPCATNPPVVDSREIVARLFPLFLRVSESVAVLPSRTVPKERLDGLAEIRREYDWVDAVPEPFKPNVPASPQLKKTVPAV